MQVPNTKFCHTILILVVITLAPLATGCANVPQPVEHDPWESWNRAIYEFNTTTDTYLLKPVAQGYQTITPRPVRTGISNFFSNLDDLLVITNDLLQFKLSQALSDSFRFLVNSTIGIYGLIDVASHFGLEKHDEDFGQTLGTWGIGDGPYLVLPFWGPSNVRDSLGLAAELSLSPLDEIEESEQRTALQILDIVQTRAGLLSAEELLDQAALDEYAFVREAYLQRRRNLIYDGNPPDSYEDEDLFEDEAPVDESSKPFAPRSLSAQMSLSFDYEGRINTPK